MDFESRLRRRDRLEELLEKTNKQPPYGWYRSRANWLLDHWEEVKRIVEEG